MAEITNMCSACAAGLYEECENPTLIDDDPNWIIPCSMKFQNIQPVLDKVPGLVGRPPLDPDKVTDPTSTGRKRAKMLAPILTGQRCAWAGLKHAGGGVVPILGCDGHLLIEKKGGDKEQDLYQGDRHHGPDKNVLNNSVGVNLHSICARCHHRWHSLNDPYYDKRGDAEKQFLPTEAYYGHDPVTAFTEEEYLIAEAWWDEAPFERGPYPFKPSEGAIRYFPVTTEPGTLDPAENPFADDMNGES